MLRLCRSLAFLASLVIPWLSSAADFQFGGVTLSIPGSYRGPVGASPAAGMETVAFAGRGWPDSPANVLQLTRIELPVAPGDSTATLSKYLLEMLGGIERHRSAYSRTAPEYVRLGSLKAVRAGWKGSLQNLPTNGVMYCAIVGTRLLYFHAFGPGDVPDDELKQAIRAIEALGRHDS